MAISKFRATCFATLERIQKTGHPVLTTRFGKPVVKIVPATLPATEKQWLGSLRGSATIVGDIVEPTGDLVNWGGQI